MSNLESGPKNLRKLTDYEVLNATDDDKRRDYADRAYTEIEGPSGADAFYESSSFEEDQENKGQYIEKKITRYYRKN
jgi:hypothetical protein